MTQQPLRAPSNDGVRGGFFSCGFHRTEGLELRRDPSIGVVRTPVVFRIRDER